MTHIVHCIRDDKFFDGPRMLWNEIGSQCWQEYIILSNTPIHHFRYLKVTNDIVIIKPKLFVDYIHSKKVDVLIIHGIYSVVIDTLLKVDKSIKVYWVSWGYDLYNYPDKYRPFVRIKNLYSKKTRKAQEYKLSDYLNVYKTVIYNLLHRDMFTRFLHRVDYYSGILPFEYDLLLTNSFFRARYLPFHYISKQQFVQEIETKDSLIKGKDILIGNSANPTNNHLDVFDYLKKIELFHSKLICPLNYGGTEKYKSKIISIGKKFWGDNFVPLLDFLPLDEYNDTLNSCGFALFFHERQQAMGNIYSSLLLGRKIFMSSTSIVYQYLTSLGFFIFCEKDIKNGFKETLSSDKQRHNRSKYIEFFGYDKSIDDLKNTFQILSTFSEESNL